MSIRGVFGVGEPATTVLARSEKEMGEGKEGMEGKGKDCQRMEWHRVV